MLILVCLGTAFLALTRVSLPAPPAHSWSVVVFPSGCANSGIRVTGVYCPTPPPSESKTKSDPSSPRQRPAARVRPSIYKMKCSLEPPHIPSYGAEVVNRPVVGDFNPTALLDGYHE